MLRISSWMAIAVGLVLAVGQAVRNMDNLERWPTWGIDVAAGLILIYGGYRAIRRGSARSLAAAWGLAFGLFVSAFATHVQTWMRADPLGTHYVAERELVLMVGALLAVAAAGVAMSLLGKKTGA